MPKFSPWYPPQRTPEESSTEKQRRGELIKEHDENEMKRLKREGNYKDYKPGWYDRH